MLRRTLIRGVVSMQLPHLMRLFHRDRLVVLMYHGFTEDPQHAGLQNLDGNHIHIRKFARQLEYLVGHHNIVSLHEIAAAATGGPSLPSFPVALTMDDGYRSTYSLAFPVLQRFGARATVFVTTGFVDEREPLWPDRVEYALDGVASEVVNLEAGGTQCRLDMRTEVSRKETARSLIEQLKRIPEENLEPWIATLEAHVGRRLRDAEPMPDVYEPLRWEEIRAMAASGLVTIGNHTHRHRILTRCTSAIQRQEIGRAHQLIVENVEGRCDTFCYPNGAPGDYDEISKSILRELGYLCSPTTIPGPNDLRFDPFELRRVALNDRATFDDFLMILYGGVRGLARDLTSAGHRG